MCGCPSDWVRHRRGVAVKESERELELEKVCVYVCVRKRERRRESEWEADPERPRERVSLSWRGCVSMWVCERERERENIYIEKERERERKKRDALWIKSMTYKAPRGTTQPKTESSHFPSLPAPLPPKNTPSQRYNSTKRSVWLLTVHTYCTSSKPSEW